MTTAQWALLLGAIGLALEGLVIVAGWFWMVQRFRTEAANAAATLRLEAAKAGGDTRVDQTELRASIDALTAQVAGATTAIEHAGERLHAHDLELLRHGIQIEQIQQDAAD